MEDASSLRATESKSTHDPFAGNEIQRVVPVTEAQREIWLAAQVSLDASLAYNESSSLTFEGPLDVTAVRKAMQDLCDRHESLRSTVAPDGGELLIATRIDLVVADLDLSGLNTEDAQKGVEAERRRAVELPFSLSQGPLVRAVLVKLTETHHELILTAHHIVCDGWSLGVVAKDFMHFYRARRLGLAPDLAAPSSFADYAISRTHPEVLRQQANDDQYWIRLYDDSIPILELPSDRPRPPVRTYASLREDLRIGADLAQAIRRLGATHGASLFATMFGTFAGLIARLSGSNDVVVGVPAAGQSTAQGGESLVGHCVNLLPIRLLVDMEQDATSLIERAQTAVLDAYEHQSCTFGTLLTKLQVPRDPSRIPLVSVLFNLDASIPTRELSDTALRVTLQGNPRQFENFELFLNVSQVDDALVLECQYNTDLFSQDDVKRWLGLYCSALRRMAANHAVPVWSALAPLEEDVARLERFNATQADSGRAERIESLIARQVSAVPDSIAVVDRDKRVTYRELDQRANALALELQRRGVKRGHLVGLCCDRNAHMLVGLYGILKAGAAYVPLDPAFPKERLALMLRDAELRVTVTDANVASRVTLEETESLRVDALAPTEAMVAPVGTPDDIAYIIYTSGSTGRPKGVRVPHRSVVNLIESLQKTPGIDARRAVLSVTTLSFDIAVSEVILPLTVGARIIVADRAQAANGDELRALVEQEHVTFIDATPSTWRLLLASGWRGRRDLLAICTGEPLPPDLGRELLPLVGELWNGYGPTETTVWSTFHRVQEINGPVPIGRPIANTQIHVLDPYLRPLPVGVIGELYIAGRGVTLGYHNQPELTAERFLVDPSGVSQTTWYKTGDLGRWRADGVLECLGRTDHQVKIRGHRIELGEIETNLTEHSGVERTICITREDTPGDVRIVAYIVPRKQMPEASDLRSRLAVRLPDYMIPQHFVELSAIPLLPNGKVDRRSLPAPEIGRAPRGVGWKRPKNDLEAKIIATMEDVLNLPGLGAEDNFFSLGGHSLLASRLAGQLGRQLGLTIPMTAVFEGPTPERLAGWIRQRTSSLPEAIRPIEKSTPRHVPASLMQQRLWVVEQLEPGRTTYNTPSAHRLTGNLSLHNLERAFNEMVRRQATLRTRILAEDGVPWQHIEPELTVKLDVEDLSGLPPEQRELRLRARLDELSVEHIALDRMPLFRVRVFALSPTEHVLFFMPHHVIWDGWSFDLFYEEMASLYGAFCTQTVPDIPEPAVTYADFAEWHRGWMDSGELRRQLDHWKNLLANPPDALDLPGDRSRPARRTEGGATEWINLDSTVADAAREMGQRADATIFMTILAAYVAFLYRQTGQTDLFVGTPVRGRQLPEFENVMGFFVNALPLRVRVDPDRPFLDLVRHVREVVLDAFSSPDVPFEHLMREIDLPRDPTRPPLYQAMFSYQDARLRSRQWGNLSHSRVPVFPRHSANDLGLWLVEVPNGLTGGFLYNTDIFLPETVAHFRQRFTHLLASAIARPDTQISNLELLPSAERELLSTWTSTGEPIEGTSTVHDQLERQSQLRPQGCALRAGVTSVSYSDLHVRANRFAHLLRARDIGRGHLVGVCIERGIDMVAVLLGILKAGAAYVPLDPAYPTERLAYMAEDAGLALLITDSSNAGAVSWPQDRTVVVEDVKGTLDSQPETRLLPDPLRDALADDPAYVIYTSGSTGKPKGVVVPHRAVTNFLASMGHRPGLSESDRLVAVTTLSFDIAVLELLLPLMVGAEVVLASREQASDGALLRSLLESSQATVLQATPATWRMLIESGWVGSPTFKILVGGEALSTDLAVQLLQRGGQVWNMYGPTETTVWSTCWRVESVEQGIRIGQPIANTEVYVLDDRRQLCPIGMPGEIYIGGVGVATGYLRRPELTLERFVPNPFNSTPGSRLYRTGDRGRWRGDGTLEHLGRLDFQVKVRGHRIELGEIEATLTTHPEVTQTVAMVREDHPGDVRLVAYVISSSGLFAASELREYLRARLPEFMLPQHYVQIQAIPRLPNGKIDRKALPKPSTGDIQSGSTLVAPRTAAEAGVAAIWSELLGISDVDVTDNFFDLGGHSLLAVQAVERIHERFGQRIQVKRLIFETLEQIATNLDTSGPRSKVSTAVPRRSDKPRRLAGWLGRAVEKLRPARR